MINRVCLWPNSDQIDFNFDFDLVWTLCRASDVGGMKWIGRLCIDKQLGIYFVRIKRGTFFYYSAQTRHRRWCYQWVTELGRSANGHIRVQCLINQNLTCIWRTHRELLWWTSSKVPHPPCLSFCSWCNCRQAFPTSLSTNHCPLTKH